MSKMSAEFIRTADDRAAHDADEAAWLRHEVKRLEARLEDPLWPGMTVGRALETLRNLHDADRMGFTHTVEYYEGNR